MRHFINKIILGICMTFPLIAFSQVRYGVKGSFTYTNVSIIHWESQSRKAFAIGGFAQIPLTNDELFYFQPELIYSLQGEKDKGQSHGQAIPVNVDYFQNYINIPLMFRAYFSEAESEFFAEIGPELGFLVYQKNKDLDIKNYYAKPSTFNLSVGLGAGFSLLRKYEISARYNYGMTDTYKDYKGQNRTSVATITLAYIFN